MTTATIQNGLVANVKAYGALGDGVNDDTAAFQAAIDASAGIVPVYVPPPSQYYRIYDTLVVSSTGGLEMYGHSNLGSVTSIRFTNFPANKDAFSMTSVTGFPQLRLSGLWFTATAGTGVVPRDFYRQAVSDNHGIRWQNLYIENMSGYVLNCPVGKQIVHPELRNVHMVSNKSGGIYVAGSGGLTAGLIDHCRFAANFTAGVNGQDVYINDADGLTIIAPTFDGVNVGNVDFDRIHLDQCQGVVIIQPYIEWASATMTGQLSNIRITGSHDVSIIGGTGTVNPLGATTTYVPIRITGSDGTMLINPPISRWRGSATVGLNIATSLGTVAFVNDSVGSVSSIVVDSTSAAATTIINEGRVMRQENRQCPTLTGATPDMKGAIVGAFSQSGATNVTNLTGGGGGSYHLITLYSNDTLTTLVHNAGGAGQFILRGARNRLLKAGEVITFMNFTDAWYEQGGRTTVSASLPAAAATMDGSIVIEDGGAGNRNLIIYAGGERFRIDGGAAF